MSPDQPDQKAVGDQTQERVDEASDSIAQDAVGKLKGSHSTISSGGGRTIVFRRTQGPAYDKDRTNGQQEAKEPEENDEMRLGRT